jgi:hypothetical protein
MHRMIRTILLSAVAVAALPSAAALASVPDQSALGRDANGEPCTLTRDWSGPGGVKLASSQPLVIACRGVVAARPVGRVLPPAAVASLTTDGCGAARDVTVAGLGAAMARLCADPTLGADVVDLRVTTPAGVFAARATSAALGPVEQALRLLVSDGRGEGIVATAVAPRSVDISDLARPDGAGATAVTAASVPVDAALLQGKRLMIAGRNAEASRLLNDALSRLSSTTTPRQRAELLLETGLADSNIRFFSTAAAHFVGAEALLTALPSGDGATLQERLRLYRGLDQLNRRQFSEAAQTLGSGDVRGNGGAVLGHARPRPSAAIVAAPG